MIHFRALCSMPTHRIAPACRCQLRFRDTECQFPVTGISRRINVCLSDRTRTPHGPRDRCNRRDRLVGHAQRPYENHLLHRTRMESHVLASCVDVPELFVRTAHGSKPLREIACPLELWWDCERPAVVDEPPDIPLANTSEPIEKAPTSSNCNGIRTAPDLSTKPQCRPSPTAASRSEKSTHRKARTETVSCLVYR